MRQLTDEEHELLRKRAGVFLNLKIGAALWLGAWVYGGVIPYFDGKVTVGLTIVFTSLFFIARFLWKMVDMVDFNRADRLAREIREEKKQGSN